MLPGLAGCVGGLSGSLDAIVGDWADIGSNANTPTANANVTISFISGGVRTLKFTFSPFSGVLEYRKNSGSYINISIASGTTEDFSNGDTLNFRFAGNVITPGGTVVITDETNGGVAIDSFVCLGTGV